MPADPQTLLRHFTEQGTDHAIILLDADGMIVGWLPGAEKTFGYTPAEAVGQSSVMLFVPEDVARGIPQHELEVARANGRAEDDRWLQRKDGGRFWASGSTSALREADRVVGFGKVLRDRTEVRAQVETLQNEAQALAQLAERKDGFIALLGHELRNPLNVISLSVPSLRAEGMAGQAPVVLDRIDDQVRFMLRLIEDLQEGSRVGRGAIALKTRSVVLQDLLKDACEIVMPHARRRDQRLQALLVASPLEVEVDPDRVRQIVTNLLENAVKYTPEGGNIWLKCTVEENEAVVRVEDNGRGIDKDALPGLFELFTRARDPARTGQMLGAGLGLGLPLAKELAALHGGSIQVRSEGIDKGAEFTLRLPLQGAVQLPARGIHP